jgi:hypothetical protein
MGLIVRGAGQAFGSTAHISAAGISAALISLLLVRDEGIPL